MFKIILRKFRIKHFVFMCSCPVFPLFVDILNINFRSLAFAQIPYQPRPTSLCLFSFSQTLSGFQCHFESARQGMSSFVCDFSTF